MRYFRNPNFISFCFLILIKPGCISGIPALGILDTLLNMIRICWCYLHSSYCSKTRNYFRLIGYLA